MRRRARVAVAAAAVISAGWGGTAFAHGPCGCLDPRLGEEGRPVRVVSDDRLYRVVFNPRPTDLGIAPSYLASAYRADVPTTTVLSRPRRDAIRTGRFRVPDGTPPGVYVVLIFDRGEGGSHNTWDYVHVIPPEGEKDGVDGVVARGGPSQAPRDNRQDALRPGDEPGSSTRWPALVAAAVGGVAVGVAIGALVRKRLRQVAR